MTVVVPAPPPKKRSVVPKLIRAYGLQFVIPLTAVGFGSYAPESAIPWHSQVDRGIVVLVTVGIGAAVAVAAATTASDDYDTWRNINFYGGMIFTVLSAILYGWAVDRTKCNPLCDSLSRSGSATMARYSWLLFLGCFVMTGSQIYLEHRVDLREAARERLRATGAI